MILLVKLCETFLEICFNSALSKYDDKKEAVIFVKKIKNPLDPENLNYILISPEDLTSEDLVLVEKGDIIPVDGTVETGQALIDEQHATGVSKPEIKNDINSRIMAGSKILSDFLIIRPSLIDNQIEQILKLREKNRKEMHPNEVALSILINGITLTFFVVVITLNIFLSHYEESLDPILLCAFFAILIPGTNSVFSDIILKRLALKLLDSQILVRRINALMTASQIDTLFIDKTGTLTHGERELVQVHSFSPNEEEILAMIFKASFFDSTSEGKSATRFCAETLDDDRIRQIFSACSAAKKIQFSSESGFSGIDVKKDQIRKGSFNGIKNFLNSFGENYYEERISEIIKDQTEKTISEIEKAGGTAILLAANNQILAVLEFRDSLKEQVDKYMSKLSLFDIETILLTGDGEKAAHFFKEETKLNKYIANLSPKDKMDYLRTYNDRGKVTAMMGDSIGDLPAILEADLGISMNSAGKKVFEASDIVFLNDNPSKILELITSCQQTTSIRGNLTFFSLASDITKFYVMTIALCQSIFPELDILNILNFSSPNNVIISGLIYNILSIIMFLPRIFYFDKFKAQNNAKTFSKNLMIYGSIGIFTPVLIIKILDILIGNYVSF